MEKLFEVLAFRDPFHWGTDPESDVYQNLALDIIRSGFYDDAALRALVRQSFGKCLTWMYSIRGNDFISEFGERSGVPFRGDAPTWSVELSRTREWQNLGKLFEWAISQSTWRQRADIAAAHWNMGFSALMGHAAQPGGVGGTAKSARAELKFHASGELSAMLASVGAERNAPDAAGGDPGFKISRSPGGASSSSDPFDVGMKEAKKRLGALPGQHLRHTLSKAFLKSLGITPEEHAEISDLNFKLDETEGNSQNLSLDKLVDNALVDGVDKARFKKMTEMWPAEVVIENLQEKYAVAIAAFERTGKQKFFNGAGAIQDIIDIYG
jgi:hypothetical protein